MFNDQKHLDDFVNLCPGKLMYDVEWSSTIFIFTSDPELLMKTEQYINPSRREIEWFEIMGNDFGSGHRAAIYWAFTLWSGNSWRYDSEGNSVNPIDTMSEAYSMDDVLRRTAITALQLRWRSKALDLKTLF